MKTYLGVTVSDAFDPLHPDHGRNLQATLNELAGRDPRTEFGADVEFDRLKFTDWTPDTCGCTHRFMWHRDHPEDARPLYGHRVVKACPRHKQHADPELHHNALLAENQNKNRQRQALADKLGVPVHAIYHTIAPDGTLSLHVKG